MTIRNNRVDHFQTICLDTDQEISVCDKKYPKESSLWQYMMYGDIQIDNRERVVNEKHPIVKCDNFANTAR